MSRISKLLAHIMKLKITNYFCMNTLTRIFKTLSVSIPNRFWLSVFSPSKYLQKVLRRYI